MPFQPDLPESGLILNCSWLAKLGALGLSSAQPTSGLQLSAHPLGGFGALHVGA
jgi:hypothetical protein